MALIGKFDKSKQLGSSRPCDQATSDWPMLLASMLSKAYADPRAAKNLQHAQIRDMARSFWGPWASLETFFLPKEERCLTSRGPAGAQRGARLYSPESAKPGAPLVVMLHGCMQDAQSFARLTRMDEIAKAQGFFVLYPDQESSANPMQCWNWNAPQNQRRLGGEPEALAQLIGQAQALCGSAPERTHVAGISAGGALAATMAHLYPELLGSVAVVAGPAPFAAQNLPQALGAMARGPATGSREAIEAKASEAAALVRAPRKLPILIVQGSADATVNPKNALMQERSALALNEALAQTVGSNESLRRHSAKSAHGRTRVWRDADGDVVACVVHSNALGHAWSGGDMDEPFAQEGFDQSRLALDFFGAAESGDWSSFEPSLLAAKLWNRRANEAQEQAVSSALAQGLAG